MPDPRSQSPERVNWQEAYAEQVQRNKEQFSAFLSTHEENTRLRRRVEELERQLND